MEKYRKKLIFLLVCFLLCFILNGCTTNQDNLRLRIIANSDSEEDQQIKLIVKDALKEILKDEVKPNLDHLKEKLRSRLNSSIYQSLSISYEYVSFPAKVYNETLIPSGDYYTLLIEIGEGKGKNFWTLLYPEYFNISFEDDNEIEYRSYLYDLINNTTCFIYK